MDPEPGNQLINRHKDNNDDSKTVIPVTPLRQKDNEKDPLANIKPTYKIIEIVTPTPKLSKDNQPKKWQASFWNNRYKEEASSLEFANICQVR